MVRLLVQSYWNEGLVDDGQWVELCAVLPGVAGELRDTLPKGAAVPKTMGAISDVATAWVKRAKAGEGDVG